MRTGERDESKSALDKAWTDRVSSKVIRRMEKEVEEVVEEESADGVRRRGRTDFDCCCPAQSGRKGVFDFDKSRRNDLQGMYFARLTSLSSVIYEKQGAIGGEMNSQTGLGGSRHIRPISNGMIIIPTLLATP